MGYHEQGNVMRVQLDDFAVPETIIMKSDNGPGKIKNERIGLWVCP